MNANYNDTANFSGVLIKASTGAIDVCQRYPGNEPPRSAPATTARSASTRRPT